MVVKNKKGIFFLMLTLIIISLFLLSVTFFSEVALRKSVQKRVETLSDFVKATEDDLPRQLFITGFRTVFVVQRNIVASGNYPSETVEETFKEAFFNGTVEGNAEPILFGATYDDLVSDVQSRAREISADVQFSNASVSLSQEDPWNIKIDFVAGFYASDINHLASWNKTLHSVSYIRISNFSDPLYLLNGFQERKIIETPYLNFPSELQQHVGDCGAECSYYMARVGAPSFIDRLEGNYLVLKYPNEGIESLVYFPAFPNPPGPPYNSRSVVDYLYFNDPTSGDCSLPGVYSWFWLDTEHLDDYGFTLSDCS